MAKFAHPLDKEIVHLLQLQGLIKSEANTILKRNVYKMDSNEVRKIQNYTTHFGLEAKESLIEEILQIRREKLMTRLASGELAAQV